MGLDAPTELRRVTTDVTVPEVKEERETDAMVAPLVPTSLLVDHPVQPTCLGIRLLALRENSIATSDPGALVEDLLVCDADERVLLAGRSPPQLV